MRTTKTFPVARAIKAVIAKEELYLLGINDSVYKLSKEGRLTSTGYRSLREVARELEGTQEITEGESVRLDF